MVVKWVYRHCIALLGAGINAFLLSFYWALFNCRAFNNRNNLANSEIKNAFIKAFTSPQKSFLKPNLQQHECQLLASQRASLNKPSQNLNQRLSKVLACLLGLLVLSFASITPVLANTLVAPLVLSVPVAPTDLSGSAASVITNLSQGMLTKSGSNQIRVTAEGDHSNHWWRDELGNKYRIDNDGLLTPIQLGDQSPLVNTTNQVSRLVLNKNYAGLDQAFEQPMLVLALSFSDVAIGATDNEIYDRIYSSSNSVSSYYSDVSQNKFQITPIANTQGGLAGIVHVNLPQPHPDFGENYDQAGPLLVRQALLNSSQWVDYASLDINGDGVLSANELAIVVIVAGYENAYGGNAASHPRVWAHQGDTGELSVQSTILPKYAMFGENHQEHLASIGIICHELGHLMLGLPDLYDRNGKSYGVGRWGLMGTGSWNRTGAHLGDAPARLLSWSQSEAGFQNPQVIQHEGSYQITPNDALKVWIDPYQHGEYFLLEYRQRLGVDAGLPMQGMLITHIDPFRESQQNDDASHKWVDIESADGYEDLDYKINQGDTGDPWPGALSKNTFSSTSQPSSSSHYTREHSIVLENIRDMQTYGEFYFKSQENIQGGHIGYDEGGRTGFWKSGSLTASVTQTIFNDTAFDYLDGVDFYAHTAGRVELSMYKGLDQGQPVQRISQSGSYLVNPGWNRLILPKSIHFLPGSSLVIETSITNDYEEVQVAVDFDGSISGRSSKRSSSSENFEMASFDINQHALLSNGESALIDNFAVQAPAIESSGSRGGAAGLLSLLLLFSLLLCGKLTYTSHRRYDMF